MSLLRPTFACASPLWKQPQHLSNLPTPLCSQAQIFWLLVGIYRYFAIFSPWIRSNCYFPAFSYNPVIAVRFSDRFLQVAQLSQRDRAFNVCFRFQIYCLILKPQRLKVDCGRKSKPNFALFSPFVQIRRKVDKMTESWFQVQRWPNLWYTIMRQKSCTVLFLQ